VNYLQNHPEFTKDAFINWSAIIAASVFMTFKLVTVNSHLWTQMSLVKIVMGIPAANIANYLEVLSKAPILVKSITSGFVYLLGDLCA
jgi:protein Mpv17